MEEGSIRRGNHEFSIIEEPLASCPFCGIGGEQVLRITRLESNDEENSAIRVHSFLYTVICRGCNAEGPFRLSRQGAITAWNTRRESY